MDLVLYDIWEEIGHHTVNMTKTATEFIKFTLRVPLPEYHLVLAFSTPCRSQVTIWNGLLQLHCLKVHYLRFIFLYQRPSSKSHFFPLSPENILLLVETLLIGTTWGLLTA